MPQDKGATPTENEPTSGRSGAPPASLAGICLNEPSKTLIWTEIDYLFYSTVLPNITYGLSVYGASNAVACAAGGIV